MSLSERLDASRNRRASQPYIPAEVEFAETLDAASTPAPVVVLTPATALDELKAAAVEQLYERMGGRLTDPSLSEEQLLASARQELAIIIGERGGALTESERRDLI